MQYTFSSLRQAFSMLWQSKRSRWLLIGAGVLPLAVILSFSVYASMSSAPSLVYTGSSEEIATGTGYTTVQPILVSGSSSIILLGSILSHETANIYPRRDGIVEDIYVDIGDTVKKNQVVALLLPKGVEGQSAALIFEKQARKQQAESDLHTAQQVSEETVISARQQIKERETELMVAQREQEMMIEKFAESEANIAQMQDQALTTVQNARQLVEWILLGSNSRTRDYIEENEVLDNIGQLDSNSMSRVYGVASFNDVLRNESAYLSAPPHNKADVINMLLTQVQNMLSQVLSLLQSTPSAPSSKAVDHFSHDELNDRIKKVIAAQDSVLKAQEKIQDAQNSFTTLTASEPELYLAYRSGNIDGKKSNKVRTIETQIQTAHNSVALTEANQEQMVENKRSMLGIADAMLQSEYAQSGHRQIRSPFAGTVSKRFIEVGQIVMPSMSAFELTDVPTSLAKKAKMEVQFGLPEHLLSSLSVGDGITFFLQTDETQTFTAEVTRKSPQVDMQTHIVTVQAKVADDVNLPHRASVRIRLTDQGRPIFRVPSSTVKREDDRNYIWIIDPENFKPTKLTVFVTAEDGEFAEITGSLTEVSAVILDPPALFMSSHFDSSPSSANATEDRQDKQGQQ
jgi:HlyD family secretion protein